MWYSNIKETAKHRETVERVASIPLAQRLAGEGLSRLYDHMMRGPFAVMSASRDDFDPDENVRRSKQLREHLKSLGYGYADTRGIWSEDEDARPQVFKSEPSYFIPGISQEDADALGRKFEQQAVLYGNGGKFTFLPTDPSKPEAVAEPEEQWQDVGSAFHQIRGGPNDPPQNATQIGHKEFTLRQSARSVLPPYQTDVPLSHLSTVSERHSDNLNYFALTERRAAGSGSCGIGGYYEGLPRHDDDPNSNELLVYLPFRRARLEYDLTRLAQAAGEPMAALATDAEQEPAEPQTFQLIATAPGDREKQLRDVTFTAPYESYLNTIRRMQKFEGGALAARKTIIDKPYETSKFGMSSVWVDKDGGVHIMRPHEHTVSTYTALRDNLPEGYDVDFPASKVDHMHLTKLTKGGLMRGQFYDDGVGFSVDINHPPTDKQLRAMEDAYYSTSGEKFVAELCDGDRVIGHARNPAELYRVLDLARSCSMTARAIAAASQGMFFVRFADNLESTTGKRIA